MACFLVFIITFKTVKHKQIKSVPVAIFITTPINSPLLIMLSFFLLLLKLIEPKK